MHEERRHEVRAPHFLLLPLTVVWEASTPHGRTPAEVGFQGSRKQGRSIWMGDAEKARQALKAAVPVRSHMAGPQPRFPDEAGALVFPGGRGRWVAPLQNTAALSALRLAEQGSDGRPLGEWCRDDRLWTGQSTFCGLRFVLISVVFHARWRAPLRMKTIAGGGTLPPPRNC